MRKPVKNRVSLAGEFAVLSQLALHDYDANMTLGHTKGVDILVSDPISGRMFRVEVKTGCPARSSRSALFGHTLSWVMSEKHESISDPNLFFCFVNIEKNEEKTHHFEFFIVPGEVVSQYVKRQHQHWIASTPGLPQKSQEGTIRNFRLGLDEGEYQIPTPLAEDYRDNWDFEIQKPAEKRR